MNEIERNGLYSQNVASNSGKQSIKVIPMLIASVIVAVLVFGLGFRANEEGWLEGSVRNTANDGLPADLSYESVEKVYDELRRNFDGELTEEVLLDGLKSGLAKASGDNYTVYFNEKQTQEFYSDLNGSFEGIGAELDTEGDLIIVVSPIRGFPAEEAGLRPKDAIIEIDGEDAIGIPVEEAVSKIRGEAGTDVVLTIARNGERKELTITRASIVIPSVESELIEDGQIGYIQLSRFAEDTAKLAREAAVDFKARGVEKIILDVRSNSGGFVDAAIEVASLWLQNEVVFEQRSGGMSEGSSAAKGNPVLNGIPTVVLINEGSASASEIVAGALKDHGVAQLVGKTSFGKGSVQSLSDLGDGSTLKVTIARWFTPGGVNIDKDGITPDVEVDFTEEDFENEADPQREKAIEILKQ